MKLFIACLVALVAVVSCQRPKSECEKRRESALEHESIMKLIPKCKANGDYEALQCYKDSEFCVCYEKKGHPVSPHFKELKKCDCFLARHEKQKYGSDTSYIPQCEKDGAYKKKQCWDSKKQCWCVDDNNEHVDSKFFDQDDKTITC